MTWEGGDNATGYTLFAIQTAGGGAFERQELDDGDANSATFTGLPAGRYEVHVVAHQQFGTHYVDSTGLSNTATVSAAE